MYSDKALSAIWMNNTIQILSETDPNARLKIDKICAEKLRHARNGVPAEHYKE